MRNKICGKYVSNVYARPLRLNAGGALCYYGPETVSMTEKKGRHDGKDNQARTVFRSWYTARS